MGIFSSIKSNFKMAEAAVVIQNLLEIQESAGLFEGNRSKVANGLVRVAWETNPQIFSGKFGERPHKISVAASALAEAIESNRSDENFYAYVMSLGNIILELQRNAISTP